jgi:hypothetical protein
LLDFKIKDDGMGRARSKHGKEESCIPSFGAKTRKKGSMGKLICVCETIIMKWISKKENVAGSYKQGNERLSSTKSWKFLEWLSNCWLFKQDLCPRLKVDDIIYISVSDLEYSHTKV